MSFSFRCPVGAHADVNELEYIASLHQTSDGDDDGWLDCSIEAADVKHFLMSRHGIHISKEDVRTRIFDGLAGGNDKDECLDLTEITAILLIPRLLKCVEQECHNEVFHEVEEYRLVNEQNLDSTQSNLSQQGNEVIVNGDCPEIEEQNLDSTKSNSSQQANEIIADVLKVILGDVFGSHNPVPLTPDTLRQIFAEYEELNLLVDDGLIKDMIHMAAGDDPDALLDVETFARALTSDVTLYDVAKETSFTACYDDVFGEKYENTQADVNEDSHPSADDNDDSRGISFLSMNDKNDANGSLSSTADGEISTLYTFPNVDFIADTYRSRFQIVLSFTVFFFLLFCFVERSGSWDVCKSEKFGCRIANKLMNWLSLLTQFTVIGTVILVVLNLGNNPRNDRIWEVIASVAGVVIFIFIPVAREFSFWSIDTTKNEDNRDYIYVLPILGSCLVLIQIQNLSWILWKIKKIKMNGCIMKVLTFGETYLKDEHALKQAAAFKIDRMINNAYVLHQHNSDAKRVVSSNDISTNARSLRNYNKASDSFELVGGLVWSMKMFFSGSLLKTEGVRFNSKHLIGYLVLTVFIIVLIPGVISGSLYLSEEYDRAIPEPETVSVIGDYLPRLWMLVLSLASAAIASLSVLIYVWLMIIPSIILTTLKLRTGFLPSLRDPLFKTYRANIYSTAYVIGGMIWAPILMVFVFYFVVFIAVFILVWQVTRTLVSNIVAAVIAMVITIVVKQLAIQVLLFYSHAAFYRRRVLLSNIATVALECWHIGITGLSVITRLAKLLIVTIMYLGRIDRPFLADDLQIDNFPHLFRQSILAMEAHRHPYIERLGVMYMMKLRYGTRFGTQAGSIWRLLFVFALMPWQRKYRIQDLTDNDDIIEKLGTMSNKNYVTDLEAENRSLKLQLEELLSK